MSSFRALESYEAIESTKHSLLQRLKGLDFATWNKVVGWPKTKPGQLPFPIPFQWRIFNELMKEDSSSKSRHVAWLGSRGIVNYCDHLDI